MPAKDPLRERIEDLGRMNTEYVEHAERRDERTAGRHLDRYNHGRPRQVDDEHPDKPDRD